MSLSTKEILMLGFIPMGQLWARIFKFNGSLDHKWSMLPFFMVPPFQFIPIIMMKLGMFKKGKGGKPYDWYMLIPILARIFITIFAENYDFPMWVIIDVVLNFVTLLIPYLIRTYNLCNKVETENILNTLTQAATTQAAVNLFTFLIGFVPFIGLVFTMVEMIPYVGPLLPWTIGYSTFYIVMNMLTGDNPSLICSKKRHQLIFLIGSIIFTATMKSLELS